MQRKLWSHLFAPAFALTFSLPAAADTFKTIDFPGASSTVARGINDFGEIVGQFSGSSGTQGFLLSVGTFTAIRPPGASFTIASGINNAGEIVGSFQDGSGRLRGFLRSGQGEFTVIDVPGSNFTFVNGINDSTPRQIVGWFSPAGNGAPRGFIFADGVYNIFDHPDGARQTTANDINDGGEVVGSFAPIDPPRNFGFLRGAGFTTIDPPGSSQNGSEAVGLNNRGQIVGIFSTNRGGTDAFLFSGGSFTTLVVPGGATSTFAFGINDTRQVVGFYINSTGTHAFVMGLGCAPPPSGPKTIDNLVVGLSCGPVSQTPLRQWNDEDDNRFQLLCEAVGTAAPEFRLRYNGRAVGRCPWAKGINAAQITHPGDGDADGLFDCFLGSFWRSREPTTAQGVQGTQDWKTYVFDPQAARLVLRHFISPDGPGGREPDRKVLEEVNVDPTQFDPPAGSPAMVSEPFATCDMTRDGDCDAEDVDIITAAIGQCDSGDHYNELADADHDGCVTFGDRGILLAADSDGDGRGDFQDTCPISDLRATIVIDGCDSQVPSFALNNGCTSADPISKCAVTATNHGAFVSCVAHATQALGLQGPEKAAVQQCAAQANIPTPDP